MEDLLGNKRERETNNNDEEEIHKKQKLDDNSNIIINLLKIYKTIQQIKEDAIQEYNNLTETQRKNNSLLLKINQKFDILEDIHIDILINNLSQISENMKDIQQKNDKKKEDNNKDEIFNNNNFIEDYKIYRYTIQTNKRIELLNKYLALNKNLKDIIIAKERKDPKDILKEVLLNLNELYSKCKKLKPLLFIEEYKTILDNYDYDLKEKFFAPANLGNMNYKFSLLFSDFRKNFKNTFYNNKLEMDTDNSNIKRKFVKRMDVISLFFNTIKNKDDIIY